MTIYTGDQPTAAPVVLANDTLGAADGAQLLAQQMKTAVDVHVFSAYYQTVWNGMTLAFRPGMAYQLDPELLAYLIAGGAPMVAA